MVTRLENINTAIIEWAILRNGSDLEGFYVSNPKVKDWVEGNAYPTIKQLENFSKKVHVPFGYLFLQTPPVEQIPIPFFRTGQGKVDKVSLNVYDTIQILQERQDWLVEYLSNLGYDDLDFVGKYDISTSFNTIVQDIKQTLNLSDDWASSCATWEEALNHLTRQIEEVGIIVTFNGIVGNNTKRPIEPKECRGFVLVDKKAPFLFINSKDAKAAQMFTIIHELAHVWLGKTAGFDNQQMLPANDPVELLCDKVAAEFLVPENHLKTKWLESDGNFKNLSRIFKVSPIVIARRALDLNLINRATFFSFYNQYINNLNTEKKESKSLGGDFYGTAKKRISLRFANYVNNAVNENTLLYRDAYKLTSLKGDTYTNFINEYLYQV